MPETNEPRRFHIVQHSQWNEDVSDDGKIAWLKANIDYIRIDDHVDFFDVFVP